MNLQIISQEDVVFAGEVDFVLVPGGEGQLGVLSNHAPLFSSLKKGQIKINEKSGTKTFDIAGGFVEVLKNKVTVLI
jgi:F-type H+-transporting ATPase subunit epsilon